MRPAALAPLFLSVLLLSACSSGSGWISGPGSVSARIDRCYVDTDGLAVAEFTAKNDAPNPQDVVVTVRITSKSGASTTDMGVAHSVAAGKEADGGTSKHQSGFQKPSCQIASVVGNS